MPDTAAMAASARAEAAAAFKGKDYETAAALFGRAAALGGEDVHALHCNRGERGSRARTVS